MVNSFVKNDKMTRPPDQKVGRGPIIFPVDIWSIRCQGQVLYGVPPEKYAVVFYFLDFLKIIVTPATPNGEFA